MFLLRCSPTYVNPIVVFLGRRSEKVAHAAAKMAVHPAPKGSSAFGASATANLRSCGSAAIRAAQAQEMRTNEETKRCLWNDDAMFTTMRHEVPTWQHVTLPKQVNSQLFVRIGWWPWRRNGLYSANMQCYALLHSANGCVWIYCRGM